MFETANVGENVAINGTAVSVFVWACALQKRQVAELKERQLEFTLVKDEQAGKGSTADVYRI